MDHAKFAELELNRASETYAMNSEEYAGLVQAQFATAHAILALVERLDKLIDEDSLDENRGYLNVSLGLP